MDGKALRSTDLNLILYGEMDPDAPYIPLHMRDFYLEQFALAMPSVTSTGIVHVFGTGGDLDGGNDYSMFFTR